MAPKLTDIQHIVVVMLENRSFDHILGYLSMTPWLRTDIKGLHDDPSSMEQKASLDMGKKFPPWYCDDPFSRLAFDPPHERDPISVQLGSKCESQYSMDGFVTNYANYASSCGVELDDHPFVMSYFKSKEVPINHFLAENFAICDHWFSSLPAGTQPNRLMAMSGSSRIDVNCQPFIPKQDLVYDWLDDHDISWCVYHEGMPFFAMMPEWIPTILDGDKRFRRFTLLEEDLQQGLPSELPKVFFMEPSYTDAPHAGIVTSDDHAPSGARGGQEFLLKVYRAFSDKNPGLWKNTVMIVTYDEHGGFFDHVSPPAIRTVPPPGVDYRPFESLGVRVPAFVVSPFVEPKTVFSGLLDHTSILKFISQVFADGKYSKEVDERPVQSVFDVLNSSGSADSAPVAPNLVDYHAAPVGYLPGKDPHNEIAHCFKNALDKMRNHSAKRTEAKLGDVVGPFL